MAEYVVYKGPEFKTLWDDNWRPSWVGYDPLAPRTPTTPMMCRMEPPRPDGSPADQPLKPK